MCKILVARGRDRFHFAELCSIDDKFERIAAWIQRGYRVTYKTA